ncbi:MAG: hypothetical protein LQ349_004846 [Xanthoria aureola]|nr:MAG: hypothetical protein LQ349_004846 [Xanthoria aureola]
MWYDDYHAFDDFRAKYWADNKKAPYITPPTRAAWDFGGTISKADRDDAARKVQVFRSWFRERFFEGGRPLFIMPIENTAPRYRDNPPGHIISFQLSTVAYFSKITQKEEHLPFVVGVMGVPGSDLKLMDSILTCLKTAGRVTAVRTGSAMFADAEAKDTA